jgi:cyclic-di-GMP-binding protein
MTDPLFERSSAEATTVPPAGMRAILEWLDSPLALNTADELLPLRTHLDALRETQGTAEQRSSTLDRLYTRSILVVATLLPTLTNLALPVPRKTRLTVRNMQELLQTLAADMLSSLNERDEHLIRGLRQAQELPLWRSLQALAHHLLISHLIAAPASPGIWRQLHQAYAKAQRRQITGNTPDGEQSSLQHVYYSALLLGCAQPASFNAREIDFVVSYLQRFADCVDPLAQAAPQSPSVFWIDPRRDTPAFACSRKTAPPETAVQFFSCERLAALLDKQLTALETGSSAQQIGLPSLAGSPAGHAILRHLATYWGSPLKRRFQRRRQNYRAALCAGLDNLWHLFQEGHTSAEVSSWMIINESPDGYAVMHVSGKTGKLSVGDVAAIRTESGNDWQICLVRWALSENPEHLELGLQILAPRAVPAILALPSPAGSNEPGEHLPALILPELPPLRATQMLLVPTGAVANHDQKLVLVVEQDNVEVREVRASHLDEQTGSVEVFAILPDERP